jgi:hypothetical protein
MLSVMMQGIIMVSIMICYYSECHGTFMWPHLLFRWFKFQSKLFQKLLRDTPHRVGGFMGSHHPPGGLKAVDVAVCTIEKANSLVNRLLEEKGLDKVSSTL